MGLLNEAFNQHLTGMNYPNHEEKKFQSLTRTQQPMMQGIKEQKERESSRVYVQVSHAISRADLTPNQEAYNTKLKQRTKKKRPNQYYNTLEDVWFEDFPS